MVNMFFHLLLYPFHLLWIDSLIPLNKNISLLNLFNLLVFLKIDFSSNMEIFLETLSSDDDCAYKERRSSNVTSLSPSLDKDSAIGVMFSIP